MQTWVVVLVNLEVLRVCGEEIVRAVLSWPGCVRGSIKMIVNDLGYIHHTIGLKLKVLIVIHFYLALVDAAHVTNVILTIMIYDHELGLP